MDSLGLIPDVVNPQIVEFFDQAKDQLSSELQYTKLGFEDYTTTDMPDPKFSAVSALSAAQLTLEGQPYSNEDRVQGYDVEIEALKWTKTCTYTEELYHFIMSGNKRKAQEFREGVEAVAQALTERIDTQAARLLYLAHTTTHQTGGDGVALAAHNHPSPDSTVAAQRNIPLTTEGHVPLSYDALKKARIRLSRFQDLKGVQMTKSRNVTLLVSQENEDDAKRLLYSPKLPGTDLNDNNTLSSIKLKVVDWQPATYSSYWALVDDDRMKKQAKMIWVWKPQVHSETNYMNGTFHKPASVFVQSGFTNWNFGYFSKGDSSVISS